MIDNTRIQKANNGYILTYNEYTGNEDRYNYEPRNERSYVFTTLDDLFAKLTVVLGE